MRAPKVLFDSWWGLGVADRDRVLVGRYRLVRRLGKGGMGEVWEGQDENLRRPVAVKVVSLLAGGGHQAEEARARFLREARITAALQHPHIVTVHDLGEAATDEGATPFLVMELLRGQSLEAVVRRGPVGVAEAARWGVQICEALSEAHAQGILHRDIKPGNLFVTTAGTVKVLDFGIARALSGESDSRLTRTGHLVGTAAYMAPEQARGNPEPRSDLYALGCVLYEMLTGRLPFTATDVIGYLSAHLQDPPPAPSSLTPGLPEPWDRLVLRLLAKEPDGRPESAAELATELRALAREQEPPAAPPHPPAAAPAGELPQATRPLTMRATAALPPGTTPQDEAPADPPETSAPGDGTPAVESGLRRNVTRRNLLVQGASLAVLAGAGGTAVYLAGGPSRGPIAWSQRVEGVDLANAPEPHVVAGDGRCVVATGNDYRDPAGLHVFNLANGEKLWETSLDELWVGERFALGGGVVYATTLKRGDYAPRLRAFDAADGTPLMEQDPFSERLAVHEGSGLLIVSDGQKVKGIDPRTEGGVRWEVNIEQDPATDDFQLAGNLVLCRGGHVVQAESGENHYWYLANFPLHHMGKAGYELDTHVLCYENGQSAAVDLVCYSKEHGGPVVWRTAIRQEDASSLADAEGTPEDPRSAGPLPPLESLVSGDTLLLPPNGGDRGKPTAVNVRTGEEKWTLDDHDGTGVLSVPGGYLVPRGSTTVCVSAEDGSELWRDKAGGTPKVRTAGPYAALYRTTRQRLIHRWTTVRFLDADNGSEVWRGQFGAARVSSPVSTENRILLVDGGGTLWAVAQ